MRALPSSPAFELPTRSQPSSRGAAALFGMSANRQHALQVTLLNFAITEDGLSDQLLNLVVAAELPELELQRQRLVLETADNKSKLKELEDSILNTLSNSEVRRRPSRALSIYPHAA